MWDQYRDLARVETNLTVLLVDDDAGIRQLLGGILTKAGYQVVTATDARAALEELARRPVDVIVSDIVMSGQSGLELLKQAHRRWPGCEVILMTAFASVDSAIQALREGASDYLTKPVTKPILLESLGRAQQRLAHRRRQLDALAVMEASLRQVMGQAAPRAEAAQPAAPPSGRQYKVGVVSLDVGRYVIEVAGQKIDATPSEFEILHHLCRSPDRVLTPQELIQAIRGYNVEPRDAQETIRSHISNLRRKLLAASPQADVIVTIRAVGYRLRTPDAADQVEEPNGPVPRSLAKQRGPSLRSG